VSLGILLATFMGGLCIGSLWLPLLRTRQHPLRVYAALEFGISVCAILVQYGLPYLNRVYISGAEHGLPGMILRALLAAICILPPTILMGASLPAIARWIKKTPNPIMWAMPATHSLPRIAASPHFRPWSPLATLSVVPHLWALARQI
jgi:spermidine synthase